MSISMLMRHKRLVVLCVGSFLVAGESPTNGQDDVKKAESVRSVKYDAGRGTLPINQGFKLHDDNFDHPLLKVRDGVLHQGPTSTAGYQQWHNDSIPLDFRADGTGIVVEWELQVESSGHYRLGAGGYQRAGFGVSVYDRKQRGFDLFFAEDRVLLQNQPDASDPAELKFDTTDDFHRYRFVVDDAQGMLFIDGNMKPALKVPIGEPNRDSGAPNRVYFGDTTLHAASKTKLKSFSYVNSVRAKLAADSK